MDGPENEQLVRLQAEVQILRGAIQLLTKSTQLRAADAAAITVMVQTPARMTMLAPLCNEPLVFVPRELYKAHRDKPKVTALYRERFQSAFESLLRPISSNAYSLTNRAQTASIVSGLSVIRSARVRPQRQKPRRVLPQSALRDVCIHNGPAQATSSHVKPPEIIHLSQRFVPCGESIVNTKKNVSLHDFTDFKNDNTNGWIRGRAGVHANVMKEDGKYWLRSAAPQGQSISSGVVIEKVIYDLTPGTIYLFSLRTRHYDAGGEPTGMYPFVFIKTGNEISTQPIEIVDPEWKVHLVPFHANTSKILIQLINVSPGGKRNAFDMADIFVGTPLLDITTFDDGLNGWTQGDVGQTGRITQLYGKSVFQNRVPSQAPHNGVVLSKDFTLIHEREYVFIISVRRDNQRLPKPILSLASRTGNLTESTPVGFGDWQSLESRFRAERAIETLSIVSHQMDDQAKEYSIGDIKVFDYLAT